MGRLVVKGARNRIGATLKSSSEGGKLWKGSKVNRIGDTSFRSRNRRGKLDKESLLLGSLGEDTKTTGFGRQQLPVVHS